jgi:hypothetical protein
MRSKDIVTGPVLTLNSYMLRKDARQTYHDQSDHPESTTTAYPVQKSCQYKLGATLYSSMIISLQELLLRNLRK